MAMLCWRGMQIVNLGQDKTSPSSSDMTAEDGLVGCLSV